MFIVVNLWTKVVCKETDERGWPALSISQATHPWVSGSSWPTEATIAEAETIFDESYSYSLVDVQSFWCSTLEYFGKSVARLGTDGNLGFSARRTHVGMERRNDFLSTTTNHAIH